MSQPTKQAGAFALINLERFNDMSYELHRLRREFEGLARCCEDHVSDSPDATSDDRVGASWILQGAAERLESADDFLFKVGAELNCKAVEAQS